MKCKEIEPLIYLYKPGELTENELFLLEEHLKICKECKKLRESLLGQSSTINELTKDEIITDQSSFYKELIFEKIKNLVDENSGSILKKDKSAGLYYFSLPLYRYISAALIAAFVITFLLQNYLAYLNLGQLELRYGNPSSYEAAEEIRPIVFGKEDIRFISQSSQNRIKSGKKLNELSWFKGTQFLLLSIRKHSYLQKLTTHNLGIDPTYLVRIYNKSVYLGESKRNQN
jgi:Putative zinc-finger